VFSFDIRFSHRSSASGAYQALSSEFDLQRSGAIIRAKNMKTLLTKALNELVVVTDQSGCRKLSKLEAIVTQLVNR
jgi:hypothetical protein